jgi:hypothetical protein
MMGGDPVRIEEGMGLPGVRVIDARWAPVGPACHRLLDPRLVRRGVAGGSSARAIEVAACDTGPGRMPADPTQVRSRVAHRRAEVLAHKR